MNNIRTIMWRWGDALAQCERYSSQIREFEQRIRDMRGLSGYSMDGMPHPTGISNPVADKVEKICDLYERTNEQTLYLLQQTLNLTQRVDALLDECPALWQRIAYLRYRESRPWVYVGIKLNISEPYARKIDERMCRYITESFKEGEDEQTQK